MGRSRRAGSTRRVSWTPPSISRGTPQLPLCPLSPLPFYSSPPKTPTSFLPPQNPPWASLVPDKVLVLTSTPR